ncbi:MAG: cyclic nucleotide-binding domain-containing protein [Spirochaetales bacterium]|nr:cyclic nucleotide-binding domain-containing protein [Spirochaetales bacterium]
MTKTDLQEYREKLKKIAAFRYFTDPAVTEFLRIAHIEKHKKGDCIITEGDMGEVFYAVLDGTVNISVKEKDKGVFICALGEGEVFGEAAIFLKMKRTANVVSADNSVILSIHRKDLLHFIQANPSDGIKFLMVTIYSLLKKLRDSNQELAYERRTDTCQDDIDSIIESIMKES